MENKNNERDIFFFFSKDTGNLINKNFENSIENNNGNTGIKKFVFFDILNNNKINFLVEFKEKKLFLMTKVNYFGSSFFNNEVINPINIILSEFDPNILMINIIFFTTYTGNFDYYNEKNKDYDFIKEYASKFRLTNFNKFRLEDMFKDYINKLKNYEMNNINENDIEKNKEFVYEFLLPFYNEKEENNYLEIITDRENSIYQ